MKTVVINLVAVVNTSEESTPFFGFKEMVQEYCKGKTSEIEHFFIYVSRYEEITKLRLYELRYGILGWYMHEHIFPTTFLNKDAGGHQLLTKLFNAIVTEEKENYNKILVTYGHGTGFNIFDMNITYADVLDKSYRGIYQYLTKDHTLETKENYTENKQYNKVNSFVSGLKNKYAGFSQKVSIVTKNVRERLKDHFTTVTMEELSAAISESEYAKKLDAIFFGNCYMHTMDTFYALHKCTRYLIGTPTVFSWQGYDYTSLNNLSSGIDNESIKTFVKTSFLKIDDKAKYYPQGPISKEEMVLSVLSSERADRFFDSFNALAALLLKNFGAVSPALLASFSAIPDMSGTVENALTDLMNGLNSFKQSIQSNSGALYKSIIQNIEAVSNGYKEVLVYQKSGAFYAGNKIEPNGISINFPVTYEGTKGHYEFFTAPNDGNEYQSQFAKISKWGELIDKIIIGNPSNYIELKKLIT